MSRHNPHRKPARFVLAVAALASVALGAPRLPAQAARKALTVEAIFGQRILQGSQLRSPAWSPDGKLLSFYQPAVAGT